MRYPPQSSYSDSNTRILAEESARAFMAGVYRWMVLGLAVTGGTALYVASNGALFESLLPWMRPLILVELGLVLALSWLASRINGVVAGALFLAYALVNGVTFSVIFSIYQLGSIASVFFVTAATFGALSLYGTFTKKDLSAWGTFLIMGLFGLVIAGVVNIFLHSEVVTFVTSCAGVVVFAGLTAWDTQKLRAFHASTGFSSAASLSIAGALTLYLDFINLFISLLRLMGKRR
jgi:FtsH-binding integral membrane protein